MLKIDEKRKKPEGGKGESCPKIRKVSYRSDYKEDFVKIGARFAFFAFSNTHS